MNQVYAEIEEYLPHLRRYAMALAHNPVAADDLVQETVTRALTKSRLFREGTNLRAWLFTVMHNVHISNARRNKHIGAPIDPDIAAATLATRPSQEDPLLLKALEKAMRIIPDTQRVAVILTGVEGMSYDEISEHLNVPVGTIKSRVSRGRGALRKALHGREKSWHGRADRDLRARAAANRNRASEFADGPEAGGATATSAVRAAR